MPHRWMVLLDRLHDLVTVLSYMHFTQRLDVRVLSDRSMQVVTSHWPSLAGLRFLSLIGVCAHDNL